MQTPPVRQRLGAATTAADTPSPGTSGGGPVRRQKPNAHGDDTAAILVRRRPAHGRWGRRLSDAALGAAAVVLAIALWEILARTGVLPAVAFPPASDVGVRFANLVVTPAFWTAVWETISIAALGLAIVIVVAVPLGMAIGRSRWFERSTLLVVEFLKPIPPVALLPVALLFWGPSPTMKVFLVCMGAIWPLLVQVAYGARGIDGTQLDVARSYRLGRWKTVRHIVLPHILPFALTGLRVSATIAIVVAVVAELIGGVAGIGQQITLAQSSSDLPTMYAYIIAAGLLGLAVNGLFVALGRPLLFWHPSERSKGD